MKEGVHVRQGRKENLRKLILQYTNFGLTKSNPGPGEGAHMADPHLGHRSPGTTMVHSFSKHRASYRAYDRDQHSGADQQSVVNTRVTFNANEIATRTSMNFVNLHLFGRCLSTFHPLRILLLLDPVYFRNFPCTVQV